MKDSAEKLVILAGVFYPARETQPDKLSRRDKHAKAHKRATPLSI